MNRVLLSGAVIAKALTHPPAKGATRFLWDSKVPGLAARIAPTGGCTFVLQYRYLGRQTRMKLASLRFTRITEDDVRHFAADAIAKQLAEVRTAASAHLSELWQGRQPLRPDRTRTREEEQIENEYAVERIIAEFTRRHLANRSPAYQASCEGNFRRVVLPAWRGRDVRSITRRDVHSLVDGVHDSGRKTQANRVLGMLSSLFAWAVSRDLLEVNPALGVRKPSPERRRERVLTDEELAVLWHCAGRLRSPVGQWFRFMMLTAQRRGECTGVRWEEVDFAEGTWTLAASQTKAHRAHLVPISPEARDVLVSLPGAHSGFVFATSRGTAITSFDFFKKQIDREVAGHLEPVAPWKIHDLRRTAATGMEKLGVQPHVVAAVLNHAAVGVTQRHYALYRYGAEKREALTLWGEHVRAVAAQNPLALTEGEKRHAAMLAEIEEGWAQRRARGEKVPDSLEEATAAMVEAIAALRSGP